MAPLAERMGYMGLLLRDHMAGGGTDPRSSQPALRRLVEQGVLQRPQMALWRRKKATSSPARPGPRAPQLAGAPPAQGVAEAFGDAAQLAESAHASWPIRSREWPVTLDCLNDLLSVRSGSGIATAMASLRAEGRKLLVARDSRVTPKAQVFRNRRCCQTIL